MWTDPEAKGVTLPTGTEDERIQLIADGCDTKLVSNQIHKHVNSV